MIVPFLIVIGASFAGTAAVGTAAVLISNKLGSADEREARKNEKNERKQAKKEARNQARQEAADRRKAQRLLDEEDKQKRRAARRIQQSADEIIAEERGRYEGRTAAADRALSDFTSTMEDLTAKQRRTEKKARKEAGKKLSKLIAGFNDLSEESKKELEKLLKSFNSADEKAKEAFRDLLEEFKNTRSGANEELRLLLGEFTKMDQDARQAVAEVLGGFKGKVDEAADNLASLSEKIKGLDEDAQNKVDELIKALDGYVASGDGKLREVLDALSSASASADDELKNLKEKYANLEKDAKEVIDGIVESFKGEGNRKLEDFKESIKSMDDEATARVQALLNKCNEFEKQGRGRIVSLVLTTAMMEDEAIGQFNALQSSLEKIDGDAKKLLESISSTVTLLNTEGRERLNSMLDRLSADAKSDTTTAIEEFKKYLDSLYKLEEEASKRRMAEAEEAHKRAMEAEASASANRLTEAQSAHEGYMAAEKAAHERRMGKITPKEAIASLDKLLKIEENGKADFEKKLRKIIDRYCQDENNLPFAHKKVEYPENLSPIQLDQEKRERAKKEQENRGKIADYLYDTFRAAYDSLYEKSCDRIRIKKKKIEKKEVTENLKEFVNINPINRENYIEQVSANFELIAHKKYIFDIEFGFLREYINEASVNNKKPTADSSRRYDVDIAQVIETKIFEVEKKITDNKISFDDFMKSVRGVIAEFNIKRSVTEKVNGLSSEIAKLQELRKTDKTNFDLQIKNIRDDFEKYKVIVAQNFKDIAEAKKATSTQIEEIAANLKKMSESIAKYSSTLETNGKALSNISKDIKDLKDKLKEYESRFGELDQEIMEAVKIAEDNMFDKFNEWLSLILDAIVDKNNLSAYVAKVNENLKFIFDWAGLQTDVKVVEGLEQRIQELEKNQSTYDETQREAIGELRREFDERMSGLKNSFVLRLNQLGKEIGDKLQAVDKKIQKMPRRSDINGIKDVLEKMQQDVDGSKGALEQIKEIQDSLKGMSEEIVKYSSIMTPSERDLSSMRSAIELLQKNLKEYESRFGELDQEIMEAVKIAEDNMFDKFNEWLSLILGTVELQTDVKVVKKLEERIQEIEKNQGTYDEAQRKAIGELRREFDERMSGLKNSFVLRLNQLGKEIDDKLQAGDKKIKKMPKRSDINRIDGELKVIRNSLTALDGKIEPAVNRKFDEISFSVSKCLQMWKSTVVSELEKGNKENFGKIIGQIETDVEELKDSLKRLSEEDLAELIKALQACAESSNCSEENQKIIKNTVLTIGNFTKTWTTTHEPPVTGKGKR